VVEAVTPLSRRTDEDREILLDRVLSLKVLETERAQAWLYGVVF
jgi:hypothetical protein